jgi:glycosyltransferase involved in cell wall biosynthesis
MNKQNIKDDYATNLTVETGPPVVSVIVPCQNEVKYISDCLESLLNSSYPPGKIEIIVIDGMSSDGTREILSEIAKDHPEIRLIDNPKKITPSALNLGIQNSSGELIMIASAHSSFPANYIPELVGKLYELDADVTGGTLNTIAKNPTPKALSIVKILSNRFGVGNSMFRIGAGSHQIVDTVPFGIYKKEVFKVSGLYNEKLVRNHDIELSKRILKAKRKIFLVSGVTCNYYARETFTDLALNNFRNGYWNILTVYITKKFSSLSLRHFVPLLFLLSLIIPFFLVSLSGYFMLIPILTFALYNIFILMVSLKLKSKDSGLTYLVRGFYVLHFSYGFGSLIGLLRIDKLFSHHV